MAPTVSTAKKDKKGSGKVKGQLSTPSMATKSKRNKKGSGKQAKGTGKRASRERN